MTNVFYPKIDGIRSGDKACKIIAIDTDDGGGGEGIAVPVDPPVEEGSPGRKGRLGQRARESGVAAEFGKEVVADKKAHGTKGGLGFKTNDKSSPRAVDGGTDACGKGQEGTPVERIFERIGRVVPDRTEKVVAGIAV